MVIFLFIAFAAYAVLLWRDFDFALRFFPVLLPTYLIRFQLGPLPSTALEIFFLSLLLAWLYKKGSLTAIENSVKEAAKNKFFWPGVLLLFGATLSIFVAPDMKGALGIWKAYFIEPFLLFIILLDQVKTKEGWKQVFVSLGLVTIFLTCIAIIQSLTGWWSPTWEWTLPESRRVTSLFTSPNALGLFVGPITLLYAGWLWLSMKMKDPNPRLRLFQVFVILAGLLSVYVAMSRGAMIAMAAGFLFLLWQFWSKKWTTALTIGLIMMAAFIPSVKNAVTDIASFQVDSGQSRLALYKGTSTLLQQSPILGLGLASFADRFETVRIGEFTEKLIYPHNIFLNFWSETSLFGLLALFWFLLLFVQLACKKDDMETNAIIAAFIVLFIHGLVDVPYFKNDLAMMTWVLLAALAFVESRSSQKRITRRK